jgi:hypothetical protein
MFHFVANCKYWFDIVSDEKRFDAFLVTDYDLYIHAKSEHHLAQKRAVLTTLISCAKTLCNLDSLRKEI